MTAGSRTEPEVASQPDCWREAALLADGLAGLLPARGERVAVAGCGTSWFIAQSYAAAREEAGHGETDAFAASEMPAGRRYDRVLLLCRSGTTTEILQLLGRLRGTVPTVAITAAARTPVAEAADAVIELSFADEESVVQTRFATTELALLLAHLGHDLGPAADAAERVLAAAAAAGAAGRPPVHLPRHRLDLRAGQRGRAQAARGGRDVDRGLPGDGVPARPDLGHRPGQRGVDARAAAGRAGRGGRRGRRHVWLGEEDPLAELVRVQRLAVAAGPGPRAGPGPAAEPDPVRDPRCAVILVVCLNPALDVTHDVAAVDWAGVNRPGAVHDRPGGKGLNVARTLRALGADVLVTGLAGGITGAGVAGGAARARGAGRVDPDRRARPGAPSPWSTAAAAPPRSTRPAPPSARPSSRVSCTIWEALAGAARWCCPGSLPPGLPADAYADADRGGRRGRGARGAGRHGEALRLGAAAGPAMVKPNLAELEALAGRPLPAGAGADLAAVAGARASCAGPAAVVVSLGPDGLLAVTGDGTWQARPPAAVAGNPTGAGDAVVAALAHWLVLGPAWDERLRHAAALGAATAAAPVAGEFRCADYLGARWARSPWRRSLMPLAPWARSSAPPGPRAAGSARSTSSGSSTPRRSWPVPRRCAPRSCSRSARTASAYHGALEPIARAAWPWRARPPCPSRCTWTTPPARTWSGRRSGSASGSVMFDASALAYAENVRATAELTRWCHDRGVWVEAELGEIGGKNGVHAPRPAPSRTRRPATSRPPGWTRWRWRSAARTPC